MPVQPDSHVCVQGVWYQPDAPRWHDNAFGAQFVLAYMRLVRAGEVRAQRRCSTTWNAVQAERMSREAGVTGADERDARVAGRAVQRAPRQRIGPRAAAASHAASAVARGDRGGAASTGGSSSDAPADIVMAEGGGEASDDEAHAGSASGNDLHVVCGDCDDTGIASAHQGGRRTRRSDHVLCLNMAARDRMRAQFGGGGTRLADARRARGDGY